MRELPIIFNTEMVKAILDGRKTQTRRPVKDQDCIEYNPEDGAFIHIHSKDCPSFCDFACEYNWPYKKGDRLYVRETLYNDGAGDWFYSNGEFAGDYVQAEYPQEWERRNAHRATIPSIHMPKWASRIWLEVTDVRVERVQDISADDARAEGHPRQDGHSQEVDDDAAIDWFSDLWQDIYGNWSDNPWIWVTEFKVIKK